MVESHKSEDCFVEFLMIELVFDDIERFGNEGKQCLTCMHEIGFCLL